MMHPNTKLGFVDDEIGHGVFATQLIPRGTITWALDEFDQVLSPERVVALPDMSRTVVEEYAYIDADGNYVLCWDLARYVNHACQPTSRGVGPHIEIAVRDIRPGEQLTSDYSELNVTGTFRCACGLPQCRGVVGPDDLLRHWQEWDALVAEAYPLLRHVPQPLWPFVRDKEWIDSVVSGRESLPSRRSYRAPRGVRLVPRPSAPPAPNGHPLEPPRSRGLWRLG
jgi:hypothetical protein